MVSYCSKLGDDSNHQNKTTSTVFLTGTGKSISLDQSHLLAFVLHTLPMPFSDPPVSLKHPLQQNPFLTGISFPSQHITTGHHLRSQPPQKRKRPHVTSAAKPQLPLLSIGVMLPISLNMLHHFYPSSKSHFHTYSILLSDIKK